MRYHDKHFEDFVNLLSTLNQPEKYLTHSVLGELSNVPGDPEVKLESCVIHKIEFGECVEYGVDEDSSEENPYFVLLQLSAVANVRAVGNDAVELAQEFLTIEEGEEFDELELSLPIDCQIVLMVNYCFRRGAYRFPQKSWDAVAGSSDSSSLDTFPWFEGDIHTDPDILAAFQRLNDSE